MKYTEVLKKNRELGQSLSGAPYRIAILSNIVISQLKELLEYELRQGGINAEVLVGNYDSILRDSQEVSDVSAVIIFWESGNLIEGLDARIHSMSMGQISELIARVEAEVELVVQNLRNVPMVLFNRFTAAPFFGTCLVENPLSAICRPLNVCLEMRRSSRLILVNSDEIIGRIGVSQSVDFRQYYSSKALYSLTFLSAYARQVAPAIRAAGGYSKKVLVVDCDNTLWSGVLGEEGENGIQMGDTSWKGRVFRDVQLLLLGLRQEGVMLAICSKNNLADVEKVLSTHPDAVLGLEDFVATKINWDDKVKNIMALASELNLGLDTFIFLDDSLFELERVSEALPMVKCVQVPVNLTDYPALLRALRNDFFTLVRTDEDKMKTELYHQEAQRRVMAARFDSVDAYLASLGLKMSLYRNENHLVSRAAQLTQKTNQFNLTTRRYSEAQLELMLKEQTHSLKVFSLSDRHGDYGVTGMALIKKFKKEQQRCQIEVLLMSCRVIGRNVEYAFFDEIVRCLKSEEIREIRAEYISTQKNSQVSSFYDGLGFEIVSKSPQRTEYRLDISTYKPKNISYIAMSGDNNL